MRDSTFRDGYGWIPALSDPDPRVRHAARMALYGVRAGKVRRYGVTRARTTKAMGARDGDVERFLDDLRGDKGIRKAWRGRIEAEYGVTLADVRRVVGIRGRPPKEVVPLREHVAAVFADMVDRETFSTQRGRGVSRRTLLVLYQEMNERQLDRLLDQGRELRESDLSISLVGTDPESDGSPAIDEEGPYLEPEELDEAEGTDGEDAALEDDRPGLDAAGRLV